MVSILPTQKDAASNLGRFTLLTWGWKKAPSAWTTTQPLSATALSTGHTYVFDAFGDLQKWSADELRVTVEDLTAVAADTSLVAKTDPKTGASDQAIIRRDQFTSSACTP